MVSLHNAGQVQQLTIDLIDDRAGGIMKYTRPRPQRF
jgi:hypothetical protein